MISFWRGIMYSRKTQERLTKQDEDFEIAEDLQLLELEMAPKRYRPGYRQYLKSPEHDLELFLDKLDAERRAN